MTDEQEKTEEQDTLVYCPECGAVYVAEVARSCTSARCEGSHEWGPRPLQPVKLKKTY